MNDVMAVRAPHFRRLRANSTGSAISPRVSLLDEINPKVKTKKKHEEPILKENPDRFVLFPIEHPDIFKMYKDLVAVRWIPEEVDLSKDMKNSNDDDASKFDLSTYDGKIISEINLDIEK